MMVYVPGWDQSGLKCLLPQLQSTPLLHFGDLDPNGYRIFTHLCQFHGNATLFTPPFWSEYLQSHGQEKAWPDGLDLEEANEAWQRLSKASRWLEQECFILDPRLPEALKAALEDILA